MGRAAAFMVGVPVIRVLTLGLAATALAGTGVGVRFQLRQTSTVNAVTKLVGSVAGPSLQADHDSTDASATALDLQVEPGKASMTVDSDSQVANLNSDKLDGRSAGEIGVNDTQKASGTTSNVTSDSPKTESVSCPAGRVVVGTGYRIGDGHSGSSPNQEANVVIKGVVAGPSSVSVTAVEEEPTSLSWLVNPQAICAQAP